MAQIIVDSGSTKADWRVVTNEGILAIRTEGFNPYFVSNEGMIHTIEKQVIPAVGDKQPDQIYFYGAGCAAEENKQKVRSVLQGCFPDAALTIETDLLGAARALLDDQPGLIIILGTGSGSGFYDGEKIIQSIDSLGYILGDEGSGANIGMLVLRDWLRNSFPPELDMKFFQFCQLSRDEILDRLYHQPFPNRFLAQFARFAIENKLNNHMYLLILDALSDLIGEVILKYENHDEYSLNFVGSIASACSDILIQESEADGMRVGRILKSPIEELVAYHLNGL